MCSLPWHGYSGLVSILNQLQYFTTQRVQNMIRIDRPNDNAQFHIAKNREKPQKENIIFLLLSMLSHRKAEIETDSTSTQPKCIACVHMDILCTDRMLLLKDRQIFSGLVHYNMSNERNVHNNSVPFTGKVMLTPSKFSSWKIKSKLWAAERSLSYNTANHFIFWLDCHATLLTFFS